MFSHCFGNALLLLLPPNFSPKRPLDSGAERGAVGKLFVSPAKLRIQPGRFNLSLE